MRKILDVISVLAFVISLSLGAGSFLAYRWATNPKTHEMLQRKAIEAVKSSLPIPGGKMVAPKTTGGALPF